MQAKPGRTKRGVSWRQIRNQPRTRQAPYGCHDPLHKLMFMVILTAVMTPHTAFRFRRDGFRLLAIAASPIVVSILISGCSENPASKSTPAQVSEPAKPTPAAKPGSGARTFAFTEE